MRVVRLKPYLRAMARMKVDNDAMREIELDLVRAPEIHPIIRGLRGVRKARFPLPGRGKSGGGRVIYYVEAGSALYMLTAYPKNEQDDLSPEQRKAILAVMDEIKELGK
jgi:hypothetical protein